VGRRRQGGDALSERLHEFFPDGAVDALRAEIDTRVQAALTERTLLTVAEYAARSGLTQKAVRHRLERGQLQHVRHGERLLIPVSSSAGSFGEQPMASPRGVHDERSQGRVQPTAA
jgi:hypothetical protein